MIVLVNILIVIALVIIIYKLSELKQSNAKLDYTLWEIKSALKKLTAQDVQKTTEEKQQHETPPTMSMDIRATQIVQEEPQPIQKEPQPIQEEPLQILEELLPKEEAQLTIEEPLPAIEEPQPIKEEPRIIQTPRPETFRKQAPTKSESNFFKNIFNESLLGKIGIITLVAGIGFFVKHAIDQNWINEIGRVSIGILTGVIIIGLAYYLHKKYKVFSAILTGGGIAVLYITITLAFREYQLFGQTPAFAILIAITLLSVVLSLLYDRKELALFSLLGGYASPLMISTGDGNYIVLFSFILILNTGMLLISMRKNWTIIKVVSFAATIIFYFSWLLLRFDNEYTGASIFAGLFFVQFYIVAISDHLLSNNKLTPLQLITILGNNMALLMAGYYIFNDFEVNYLGLITILIAAVNAVIMILLMRNSKVSKNMIYMLIAVVLSLISLAVPIQLKGHIITLFWAAEAVIITWLWQKTRISIFNIGFQLIHMLTILSWMMDVQNNYDIDNLPIIINRMFITGLTVIASQVVCYLILRKESSEKVFMKVLTVLLWIMIYFVPFLEIKYHFHSIDTYSLGNTALFAWTINYLAVLIYTHRKNISKFPAVWGLIPIIGISALLMPGIVKSLRIEIFLFEGLSHVWFLIHYLIFPGLIYLFYFAISNIRSLSRPILPSYILAFLGVIIILAEADNTLVQIWGNPVNYNRILRDMHTFGYPILCGLIAMTLMIWGLKKQEIILRQMSLAFFGIIILKFYLIDVWRMSQADRILPFVALGIILLLVYFLLQKIKGLVTDNSNKEPTTTNNDSEES